MGGDTRAAEEVEGVVHDVDAAGGGWWEAAVCAAVLLCSAKRGGLSSDMAGARSSDC